MRPPSPVSTIALPIARTALESSSLASAGYSDMGVLEIEFRNGAVYRYFAVPQNVYERLLAASSIGTYFQASVRGRYPFLRVRQDE